MELKKKQKKREEIIVTVAAGLIWENHNHNLPELIMTLSSEESDYFDHKEITGMWIINTNSSKPDCDDQFSFPKSTTKFP